MVRLKLFYRFMVRPLLHEPVRLALAVLAVALGVAVVLAIDLAGNAAAGSFHASMEALSGDMRARSQASIAAGCDVVLHCNGRFDEMCAVAEAVPVLAGAAARRVAKALASRRPGPDIDVAEARGRFAAMMAPVRADEAVRS